MECHDKQSSKGGLDLESLTTSIVTIDDAKNWVRIFDRIERDEMPPAKRPRPPEADRSAALTWLGQAIVAAERKHYECEGRTGWRRLNRNEYQNTMHDLLKIDIDLKNMLPEDGVAFGFDNVDSALDVSAVHLEKYMEAANAALDELFIKTSRPQLSKGRYTFEYYAENARHSKQVLKLPDAVVITNETFPPKILNSFHASVAGWYRFRMSIYAHRSNKPLPAMIFTGSQQTSHGKTEMTHAFSAPVEKPAEYEWVDLLEKGDTIRVVTKGPKKPFMEPATEYKGPGLAVQWVDVEGPLVNDWPPAGYRTLIGELDLTKGTAVDAQRILRGFLPRAFRRPVAEAEVAPYVELVRDKIASGSSFEAALRLSLKAVLVSPNFLYLSGEPGRLDDYSLASRLSYFLWSTAPDEMLLDLAAKKQLSAPQMLHAQVERMLDDARSAALVENFTGQWLKLREIRSTMPDKHLYPEYDPLLEWSMLGETHHFFEEHLKSDLSLLNFVASDFAIINSRLAEHYGIPGVEGLEFRKVMLKPEWHRGGLLTQASVLKVTANGTNTSPVARGVFFLDRILGSPSPPPPKNVPAIEPDIRGATTIRAQLEKHRNVESCASCHNRIDPPGAALESYDVIGGWRTKYRVVAEGKDRGFAADGTRLSYGFGQPCQTDGALPNGAKFSDITQFQSALLDDPVSRHEIARGLTEKLLMYATGHPIEFADRAEVKRIVADLDAKNYGLRTLVQDIVQSSTFQHK